MGVPADPAVATDAPDFEVRRILEERQAPGIGPRGRLIDPDRRTLPQGFVRPLVVVVEAEGVEAPLLGPQRGFRRARGFALERPVHPLMSAILLRLAGLD